MENSNFIIKFLELVGKKITNRINYLRWFYLPNLLKIKKGKIAFSSFNSVDQLVICNGLGKIEIGENCSLGYKMGGFNKYGTIELQPRYINSKIRLGNNISTNNNIFICAANYIEFGNDILIGQNVTVFDHEAHGKLPKDRRKVGEIGQVVISDNVWIGNNVIILKNTFIGENTIIAAGAVVFGKFPSNVIIGGVPARVISPIEKSKLDESKI